MGKNLSSYASDRGLITRIYRELKKLNSQRVINLLNKWTNELKRLFSNEIQMTNKYIKKCSMSLIIKKMQIKTTLRFHLTQV
jgi:hypothetical protein